MQMKSVKKSVGAFCGLVVMIGLLAGCSSNTFGGRSGASAPPASDGLAPLTTMVESYGDIELPLEMKMVPDKSIAMRTDSFQGGIHSYSGRIQVGSLKEFIIAAMRNNNWKMVGEATYRNTMLAFIKPNRTCMVVLSEGIGGTLGKTQADFYVTVDVMAEGRQNQPGAPVNQ